MRSLRQSATYTSPVAVDLDAPGVAELSGSAALGTPVELELAVPGEHLHPVVVAVHQVEVVVLVEGKARRFVELAVASADGAPHVGPALSRLVHRDALQPLVRDVSVALAVQRDRRRPHEGAVGRRGGVRLFRRDLLAVVLDELLVHRTHGHSLAGKEGRRFRPSAQHVQPVLRVAGDGHRHEEPVAAAHFLPPDRVAVLEGYRCNLRNHAYLLSKVDSRFRGNDANNITRADGKKGAGFRPAPALRHLYLMKPNCS